MINLENNEIAALPTEIGKLEMLQVLFLDTNNLVAIPNEIGNLVNLQVIDLQKNNISALPNEIGSLMNLEALYLQNNTIAELPKEIGNLQKLKTLDLQNNNLTAFSKEICNLVNLQLLDLQNNKLTELPKEICKLANLQWLNLLNNKIAALPKELGNLMKLHRLFLHTNPLLLIYGNELMNFDSRREIVGFLSRIKGLNNYKCLSNLSQFIQFISQSENPKLEVVQAEFSKLETEDKNLIYDMVYQLSGVNSDIFNWGELNAFNDMDRLYRSIRIAIQKKFESLTQDEKNEVYGRIYDLAGRPVTADWQWGEHHAFENVLRLIDAMKK